MPAPLCDPQACCAGSGLGASGMTFLDSEVPALVGEPVDGLLFTCVGVPRYRNVPAGPPGTPSRVRRVTPAT
jgi:hypothetical protein